MKIPVNFYLQVIIVLLFVTQAVADEITLENGDKLTGTVIGVEQEMLTLETDYSDPIKIRKVKIIRINTTNPVEIHLTSGEVLKGKVRTDEAGHLVVDSKEGRRETVVAWENVSAINPAPIMPPSWKGNINIGAGMQSGNTERTNASVGAEAARRSDQERFSLRLLFNYAKDEDEITARNTYGAGKYDYFFTKKLYGYIGIELLNDTFRNLNLRTVVGPGVGYQIWEDPVKSLLVEGGLSYFSEDLKEGEDDQWLTGRLASNFFYNIMNFVTFTDYFVIYPSLESVGEYQLRNEAALNSSLGSNWSLRLANVLERNSDPPSDVKKNDWQWILGLQYNFAL